MEGGEKCQAVLDSQASPTSETQSQVGRSEVGYSISVLLGVPLGSNCLLCPQGNLGPPAKKNSQAIWETKGFARPTVFVQAQTKSGSRNRHSVLCTCFTEGVLSGTGESGKPDGAREKGLSMFVVPARHELQSQLSLEQASHQS